MFISRILRVRFSTLSICQNKSAFHSHPNATNTVPPAFHLFDTLHFGLVCLLEIMCRILRLDELHTIISTELGPKFAAIYSFSKPRNQG